MFNGSQPKGWYWKKHWRYRRPPNGVIDSLVVPCDLEQVIVIADEGVEADSLVCARDLQGSGGVGWRNTVERRVNTNNQEKTKGSHHYKAKNGSYQLH